MSQLLSPRPVLGLLERLGHRADDRHLEAVEDPDRAEADHDHPVPPRPRQPVEPGRDVGGDASVSPLPCRPSVPVTGSAHVWRPTRDRDPARLDRRARRPTSSAPALRPAQGHVRDRLLAGCSRTRSGEPVTAAGDRFVAHWTGSRSTTSRDPEPRGRLRRRRRAALVPARPADRRVTHRQRRPRPRGRARGRVRAPRPAAVAVRDVRRYDLGEVGGLGLAVTDAVTVVGDDVLVSAVAEDSPNAYDDGPVVGSALALLRGDTVLDAATCPGGGAGRQGRGPRAARVGRPRRPAARHRRRRRPVGAVLAADPAGQRVE